MDSPAGAATFQSGDPRRRTPSCDRYDPPKGWLKHVETPINIGMFTSYQLVQDFVTIHRMMPWCMSENDETLVMYHYASCPLYNGILWGTSMTQYHVICTILFIFGACPLLKHLGFGMLRRNPRHEDTVGKDRACAKERKVGTMSQSLFDGTRRWYPRISDAA